MATSTASFPPPAPLKLGGDIAADWGRFKSEWENYEIVTDLADVPEKKRAAVFLACVGTAAYSVFRTFKFEHETDKSKVDKVIEAFEKHCIGEANVTYERFLFHQRVQQTGESFDDFFADLRKMAATCEFAALEDSLVRDRIVIGIRDDATRRRLLQIKKLSLADAVEACKASEATSRRLRVMGGAGEVDALSNTSSRNHRSSSKPWSDRKPTRDNSRCQFCGSSSCSGSRDACRAYGQKCRKCSKLNHYASVCKSAAKSAATGSSQKRRDVCDIESDDGSDELLALHTTDSKRAYCHLNIAGRSVHFLLDCGASVNVLPLEDAAAIDPKLRNIRPAETRLRMFDNTELNTIGMLTATVQHPLSKKRRRMDFYVAATHSRAILGIEACLDMNLIYVNRDNICAVREASSASPPPRPRSPTPSPSAGRQEPPPPRSPTPSLSSGRRTRGRGRDRRGPPGTTGAPPSTKASPPLMRESPPVASSSSSAPSPSASRQPRRGPAPSTAKGNAAVQSPAEPLTKDTIVRRYADLFTGVGLLDGDVHLEVDPSVPPVKMPPRRLPIPIKQTVKDELDAMCRDGIIEPVTEPSAWISALLVVRKPNGKVRLCIDPRPLNKALQRSHYPMPTIDDVLPELSRAKVFSTVDARNGFWNLKLDTESRALTTFETPFGRYRWIRLPFGISPSPEIFQARIHAALTGLKGVACIADDILIYGCGNTLEEAEADHDRKLVALLDRCRERNLHLNEDKLQLRRPTTVFMGHELSKAGLQPDKRKVTAILEMPTPTDRAAVHRLIGMATYLAKFMPNFSEVTAPLRELLSADVEFRWDDAIHGKSLRQIQQMLVTAPVLCYYDVTQPVTIQCDASSTGLGACILQGGKPVEYASRALTRTERESYAQIEKEMLAICFALQRFDTYVYANVNVTVETDHKPLISIVKKPLTSAPKRLQRMLLQLQRYTWTLIYRPGSQMLIADTLSRAYLPDDTATDFPEEVAALADTEQREALKMVASAATIDFMKSAAAADEQYQLLRRQISIGWPDSAADIPRELREFTTFADELAECDGLVFKGQRVVVPQEARADILQRIHSSHVGINGCIRRAQESVFYPGLTADIKKMVAACAICEAFQMSVQKEPLMSHVAPARPWEKVGVDIFTFRNKDYLITADYLSSFFEIDRLPSKRAADVIYCLKSHFARHGLPLEVCSDNNPFNSADFRSFAQKYDFKHTTSSPHYPKSNGKIENAVKTAKRLMEKATEDHEDPFMALLAWRNTPSEQLGPSPAQILFGRRTRTNLPSTAELMASPHDATAHDALVAAKARQASYYDRGARERPPLSAGDTVRTRWNDGDEWRKATVTEVLPHRSYKVQFEDGTVRRRTSKHVRFSREPPIVLRDETDNPLRAPPGGPPAAAADNTKATAAAAAAGRLRAARDTQRPPPAVAVPPTTTRSGRRVVKPAKYNDYVNICSD